MAQCKKKNEGSKCVMAYKYTILHLPKPSSTILKIETLCYSADDDT